MNSEPPRISSTLRWEDVSLPTTISVAELDDLIASKLQSSWLKTARVIGDVAETLSQRATPLDPEAIGARVIELVKAEQIEAQGNTMMWRHSELRLRGS